MNEPVDCPECSTTNEAMPDAKKTKFENTPYPTGPSGSPQTINVLDQIRSVKMTCTNCEHKWRHVRVSDGK